MQAQSLLFPQQLKSEPCPGTSPSASDKGDSSQHLWKPWQMNSPFSHPWDESSDLLLSSSKAEDLKYDRKKSSEISFSSGNLLCETGRFPGSLARLFPAWMQRKG